MYLTYTFAKIETFYKNTDIHFYVYTHP
jgi:hypothetical protein